MTHVNIFLTKILKLMTWLSKRILLLVPYIENLDGQIKGQK